MEKARVLVKSVADYDSGFDRVIGDMLDVLGGTRIKPGDKVLVKPNLLTAAPPERAIVTHPQLVRAVVDYLLEQGARVQVSDSPAKGPFRRLLRVTGLADALAGRDVKVCDFKESVRVPVGEPFKHIELARDVLEADFVINLAKLKTHGQMRLTLGVKNLFGCVVGVRKPRWHMRLGVDRGMFAHLLVKIYHVIRPGITLLDGVLAMEGEGPGYGGAPRHLGVMLGSTNAVALDMTVCRMLGIEPDQLLTNKLARQYDFYPDEIQVEGNLPRFEDFRLPEISSLLMGPPVLHGFMRRHLLQRPAADSTVCKMCGECWEYCPAGAIGKVEKGLEFDYDRCIRCYCCAEVCPQGAIQSEEPYLGKAVRKLTRGRWGD